jgi:hypothetical protein
VLAIWEPILPTDWRAPTTGALGRLADGRVRQFWDKDHATAVRMASDTRPPQPEASCCEQSGFLWDLAALYPPGTLWDDKLPPAAIFDGPIVRVVPSLEEAIAKAVSSSDGHRPPR